LKLACSPMWPTSIFTVVARQLGTISGWGVAKPIQRLLSDERSGPDDIARLTTAYEAALQLLRLTDRADPVAEFVAAKIIAVSRRSRLQALIDQNVPGARRALALASNPGRFLSTVQIGITHRRAVRCILRRDAWDPPFTSACVCWSHGTTRGRDWNGLGGSDHHLRVVNSGRACSQTDRIAKSRAGRCAGRTSHDFACNNCGAHRVAAGCVRRTHYACAWIRSPTLADLLMCALRLIVSPVTMHASHQALPAAASPSFSSQGATEFAASRRGLSC
jgi:hypothetical protein